MSDNSYIACQPCNPTMLIPYNITFVMRIIEWLDMTVLMLIPTNTQLYFFVSRKPYVACWEEVQRRGEWTES